MKKMKYEREEIDEGGGRNICSSAWNGALYGKRRK
jgi:hypothetical protein